MNFELIKTVWVLFYLSMQEYTVNVSFLKCHHDHIVITTEYLLG
jgi:hypothetical protein